MNAFRTTLANLSLRRTTANVALVGATALVAACGGPKAGVPNNLRGVAATRLVFSSGELCYETDAGDVYCAHEPGAPDASAPEPQPFHNATQLLSARNGSEDTLCAVLPDATLQCRTGDAVVTRAQSVASVSRGGDCWVTTDGAAECEFGAPGDPPTTLDLEGRTAVQIASTRYPCAVLDDGSVRCWSDDSTLRGVPVPGLSGVTQLAAAGRQLQSLADRFCAVTRAGAVSCWLAWDPGDDESFALGRASNSASQTAPAPVVMADNHAPVTGAIGIDVGEISACAILSDHRVACWGATPTNYGSNPTGAEIIGGLTAAQSLAVGSGVDCALRMDGRIYCWQDATYQDNSGYSFDFCAGC